MRTVRLGLLASLANQYTQLLLTDELMLQMLSMLEHKVQICTTYMCNLISFPELMSKNIWTDSMTHIQHIIIGKQEKYISDPK